MRGKHEDNASPKLFLRHVRRRTPVSLFGALFVAGSILALTRGHEWVVRHMPNSTLFLAVGWGVLLAIGLAIVIVAFVSRRHRRPS